MRRIFKECKDLLGNSREEQGRNEGIWSLQGNLDGFKEKHNKNS